MIAVLRRGSAANAAPTPSTTTALIASVPEDDADKRWKRTANAAACTCRHPTRLLGPGVMAPTSRIPAARSASIVSPCCAVSTEDHRSDPHSSACLAGYSAYFRQRRVLMDATCMVYCSDHAGLASPCVAGVRSGLFYGGRAAARELGIAHSSISRHIAELTRPAGRSGCSCGQGASGGSR